MKEMSSYIFNNKYFVNGSSIFQLQEADKPKKERKEEKKNDKKNEKKTEKKNEKKDEKKVEEKTDPEEKTGDDKEVKEGEDTSIYKEIPKELLHCFACDKGMVNGMVSSDNRQSL